MSARHSNRQRQRPSWRARAVAALDVLDHASQPQDTRPAARSIHITQQAVLAGNDARSGRLPADGDEANRIVLRGRTFGNLPQEPRLAATATLASKNRLVARVTMAVPMDRSLLAVLQNATPMPKHAALLLVKHGRVIAGGPAGTPVDVSNHRLELATVPFYSTSAKLTAGNASLMAVEPVSAVDAQINAYRTPSSQQSRSRLRPDQRRVCTPVAASGRSRIPRGSRPTADESCQQAFDEAPRRRSRPRPTARHEHRLRARWYRHRRSTAPTAADWTGFSGVSDKPGRS